MYIAELNNECGKGNTLKESYDNLIKIGKQNEYPENEITFYECHKLEVYFDIIEIKLEEAQLLDDLLY